MNNEDTLQKITGEYLYYKGIIRGLTEAKNKTETEIEALIAIYGVKTRHFDKLIGEDNAKSQ